MKNQFKTYADFVRHMQEIALLGSTSSLLQWDQEVYMPVKGADWRAEQLSLLSGITHELYLDEHFYHLLEELSVDEELNYNEKSNVSVTLKDIRRKRKYTRDFVEELTATISHSYAAWDEAKRTNRYAIFAPWLDKIIDLKRKEADFVGYNAHPYEALMEEFEPGMTVEFLDNLFTDLIPPLEELLEKINNADTPRTDFLNLHFSKDKQWDLGIELLKTMGLDFDSGRQDISPHPFTINNGRGDVRVTTRISENNFSEMVWSCIHEGGHALYEQGLGSSTYGLPEAEAASLGIHESQSRLWENHVGRSLAFWKFYYPKLKAFFPEQFSNINLNEFYAAINHVKPGLIRTAADELTYHFHIKIRYEAEKKMIEGNLRAADLPAFWNALYSKYLKVNVPDDTSGVLQDVHWSHGSIGYFPTYTLGSLYASQFYRAANHSISEMEHQIQEGNFSALQNWLKNSIFQHGRFLNSPDLCIKATGESLKINYFIEYLKEKYTEIYAI